MVIDYPAPGQEPQLQALWQLAFGDSAEFLDAFFSQAFFPRRCRCLTEQGRIAAALYWFDTEFREQRFGYLYAIATHPDFRNRGFCRALVADTLECMTREGYDGALLMPQSAPLREMYRKMGFADCCTLSEFDCSAGEAVPLRPISPAEYARLRRELLPPEGVIQEGANLSCLTLFASLYAGPDFLLAAAQEKDRLLGLELLGNAAAAPGILGTLGCTHGRFRMPGKDVPWAMFRPLKASAQAPGYFGLVFD